MHRDASSLDSREEERSGGKDETVRKQQQIQNHVLQAVEEENVIQG